MLEIIDDIFGFGSLEIMQKKAIGTDFLFYSMQQSNHSIVEAIDNHNKLVFAIIKYLDRTEIEEINPVLFENLNLISKWIAPFLKVDIAREHFIEFVQDNLTAGDIQSTLCHNYLDAIELIPDVMKAIQTSLFEKIPAKYVITEKYNKDFLLFI